MQIGTKKDERRPSQSACSFIIPAKVSDNRECLELNKVLDQLSTVVDAEVIVCDDASPVPLTRQLEKRVNAASNIRVLRQDAHGAVAACNMGVIHAKSLNIIILAEQSTAAVSSCEVFNACSPHKQCKQVALVSPRVQLTLSCEDASVISKSNIPAILFPRDEVQRLRGFDESISELQMAIADLLFRMHDKKPVDSLIIQHARNLIRTCEAQPVEKIKLRWVLMERYQAASSAALQRFGRRLLFLAHTLLGSTSRTRSESGFLMKRLGFVFHVASVVRASPFVLFGVIPKHRSAVTVAQSVDAPSVRAA